MNAHKQLIPYGLWQSLITPELVGQGIRFSDVQWAPGSSERLVWCQSQGGKATLMTTSAAGASRAFSGSFDPCWRGGLVAEDSARAGRARCLPIETRLYFAPYGVWHPPAHTWLWQLRLCSPLTQAGWLLCTRTKGATCWLIRARRGSLA